MIDFQYGQDIVKAQIYVSTHPHRLQKREAGMSNELLHNIAITDDDVDWVETILSSVSFDDRRRNIIKNMDTVDIQAFPGSGKTTVLIAKLAILARKWPYSEKGSVF